MENDVVTLSNRQLCGIRIRGNSRLCRRVYDALSGMRVVARAGIGAHVMGLPALTARLQDAGDHEEGGGPANKGKGSGNSKTRLTHNET